MAVSIKYFFIVTLKNMERFTNLHITFARNAAGIKMMFRWRAEEGQCTLKGWLRGGPGVSPERFMEEFFRIDP